MPCEHRKEWRAGGGTPPGCAEGRAALSPHRKPAKVRGGEEAVWADAAAPKSLPTLLPLAVSWPGVRLGPVGAGGGRPGGQARGVWTGRVAAPIHLPLPRENGQSGLLRGSRSRSGRSVQAEGDPPEALDGC